VPATMRLWWSGVSVACRCGSAACHLQFVLVLFAGKVDFLAQYCANHSYTQWVALHCFLAETIRTACGIR